MRKLRICVAAGLAAALGSCAPRPAPAPAPTPPPATPAPRPEPRPVPPPAPADWRDAPLSPGDWSYRSDAAGSSASYGPAGQPIFVLRCERPGQVTIVRTGAAAAASALTIRTSTTARSVAARPAEGALAATVPSGDPILDAIAFSRGRFTVEAPGLPTLLIPSWPEPARVVEDCRR